MRIFQALWDFQMLVSLRTWTKREHDQRSVGHEKSGFFESFPVSISKIGENIYGRCRYRLIYFFVMYRYLILKATFRIASIVLGVFQHFFLLIFLIERWMFSMFFRSTFQALEYFRFLTCTSNYRKCRHLKYCCLSWIQIFFQRCHAAKAERFPCEEVWVLQVFNRFPNPWEIKMWSIVPVRVCHSALQRQSSLSADGTSTFHKYFMIVQLLCSSLEVRTINICMTLL